MSSGGAALAGVDDVAPPASETRSPTTTVRWPDGTELRLTAERREHGDWRLEAQARVGARCRVDAVGIRLRREHGGSRLLVDGFHSWDWAGVRDIGVPGHGWWGGIWGDPGRRDQALALGVDDVGSEPIDLEWTGDGALDVRSVGPPAQLEARTGSPTALRPAAAAAEVIRAAPILLRPLDGLGGGGAAPLPGHRLRTRDPASVRGWMSWNCLGASVTAADAMTAARRLVPAGVVLVDDGWMRAWGDWEASSRFGVSIPELARALEGMGRGLGLWIAPFHVDPASAVGDEARRAGLLLTDATGAPVVDRRPARAQWVLDASLREVRARLDALGRRLGRSGVRVLKADFLYAGALPDGCDDGRRGIAALRAGLGALGDGLRGAAGEDAVVIACGAPGDAVVGLVDACRSGGDAVLRVPSHGVPPPEPPRFLLGEATLRAQERNLAARSWLWAQRLRCDVDAITLGPVGDSPAVDDAQLERWLRLVRRSGGPRLVSDLPTGRLDPGRAALLSTVLGEEAGPDQRPRDPLLMSPATGDDVLNWQEELPDAWEDTPDP